MRRASTLLATLLLAAAASGACGTPGDDIQLCGQIPEGGCPLGRGGSCDDVTCADLYDCRGGAWVLTVSCQPGGDGGGGAGAGGADVTGGGGGVCEKVAFDHTGEGTRCTPDLQEPECPAVAAETCASLACLTGCTDFFLCKEASWEFVGYCTDEGEIVVLP